ncbi:MAG: nucleoside phosphorylase [Nitrospirota bacterium]
MKKEFHFKTSDLPIFEGRVYHLGLKPEDLANHIIIVGDPERVPFIAQEYFSTIEADKSNRGLRTITGIVQETGQRVSIVSSGMGTPSIEIVLNEIVALNEIDFPTKTRKVVHDVLTIIRVGTSGGIQPDTELGTLIITEYAAGLDNTGFFYDCPCFDKNMEILEEKIREAVETSIPANSRFKGKIYTYASKAHRDVIKALEYEANKIGLNFKRGVTVTNSGFFANQGRTLSGIPLTVPEIDGVLSVVDTGIEGLRIENMEMEASFLLHFMSALGYRAGVICVVIDNRREDRFTAQYERHISDASKVALRALSTLR